MKYRSAFCTLDSVIRQLELGESTDYDLATAIDTLIATKYANSITRIHDLIYDQSEQLYNVVYRVGVPYQDTYTLKGLAWRGDYWYNANEGQHRMYLPDDLLLVNSYTWSGTALDTDDYDTIPNGTFPAEEIAIYDDVALAPPTNRTQAVVLVGIWGYHQNPASMWLNSNDTVQDVAGINSSVQEITVNNADGLNPNGVKRFETLQYIKVDDEFMLITGVNTVTNKLTVKRGVNGTTAAAHGNADVIATFTADDIFASAVRRRVVFLYNNPAETRRIVPLPDGTLQLDDENRIPLPPKREIVRAV
jgi:hypothetical protein